MSNDHKYSFVVKRALRTDELRTLQERCLPKLTALNRRYAPTIDIAAGFPDKPEYLDLLRTKWLLDESVDRPNFEDVRDVLGFAFGRLLQAKLGMQWHIIEDDLGEEVSLIYEARSPDAKYKQISFPPFSYVEKRRTVMNAEVFVDAFKTLNDMISEATQPTSQSIYP